MGQGLRAWTPTGVLVTDTPNRLPRRVGTISVAAGGSGSVTVPGTQAIWFFVSNAGTLRATLYSPIVSIAGRVISWTPNTAFDSAARVAVTLVYGVY